MHAVPMSRLSTRSLEIVQQVLNDAIRRASPDVINNPGWLYLEDIEGYACYLLNNRERAANALPVRRFMYGDNNEVIGIAVTIQ